MSPATRLWGLTWRQSQRDLKSGDVRILLAALVLAVLAVTAVGFVTDRAGRALAQEANRLLGGDAVLRSDSPIDEGMRALARDNGLGIAETAELDSMLRVGEAVQLGELHALGAGFPLRGEFVVENHTGRHAFTQPPSPGTVWLGEAGAERLGAREGAAIVIGARTFTMAGRVLQEPDAAMDYFNVAPKVYLHADDLASTGLLQPGSRVRYRMVVAGDTAAVTRFRDAAVAALERGQRLDGVGQVRPEMRSALDRASRFLGLTAMLSVLLAAIAVAMAARRHSERHLQAAAVMRCLGASQRTLSVVHVGELLLLGLLACVVGVALAFALQWGVGNWLSQRLQLDIPAPSPWPAVHGVGAGLLVLLAFGAPPVLALRRVPALRVLRRDLDPTEASAWVVAIVGLGGLALLLWQQAGSPTLAAAMLGGIAATFAVLALLAWALVWLVRRARARLRGPLRYGLASIARRPATSIAQVAALGLGLMALLLLGFVRNDLLDRWQLQLQADAPNRFIINVQSDQLDPLREFADARGMAAPTLYPMIRARLVSRNGAAVTGDDHAADGERARRLAEREFNLSMADAIGNDNQIVAGRFWDRQPRSPAELSVEEGFAGTLGWSLGDTIGFDIAGQPFEGRITSLRKVDWESFKPNFFVLASPGALDGYAASHITAVRVPAGDAAFTRELVRAMPNLSVIDIDAVLQQVRQTADQVAQVISVVFWFALAAGVLVLLAAISASQDERLRDAAVMRVLGGSRRQLRLAQASEFAAIGLLAGLVAAIAASVLSGVIASQVFDLPWQPDWLMAVVGGVSGMLAALLAGLFATRRALEAPPSTVLRELDAT
ncbi:MAG: FtsX-like permease family protein [Pseudoxanthomonas suwonensis]|nr:FtsX-like permease family protein [Pseudoxanthomonas suwonensis]